MAWFDPDEAPIPEERGALVPPRWTRPTAVGTATPPPPRPPRRWRQGDTPFRRGRAVSVLLVALLSSTALVVLVSEFRAIAVGATGGAAISWLTLMLVRHSRARTWILASVIGGAVGGGLTSVVLPLVSPLVDPPMTRLAALIEGIAIGALVATLSLVVAMAWAATWARAVAPWLNEVARGAKRSLGESA